ncbi:hypothetical protein BDN72DRAFT_881953 [Pluteus cervinus]|uniref:Uncharacterized protein n=1 Tax=Pluteus cervinus TaxID=181527 RepID=A0ACD3AE57_9AGAR|nr:hypothetical protein BDN72DRAFT_881953 [Pluteus cervinus]
MTEAATLPVELWSLIVVLLSWDDIKSLVSTSKFFYSCASAPLWRRLTICTLQPRHLKRAQSIIRDPSLGLHVRHLRLRPTVWSRGYTMTTSLWIADNPFWFNVLPKWNWLKPSRWRHFFESRKSIEVATEVIPYLTNLREITIVPRFKRSTPPAFRPYRILCASLCIERVCRLNLQLDSSRAIQVFSDAIRESGIIFHSLDTLVFNLGFETWAKYADIEDDLRAIIDCGRDSVVALGLSLTRKTRKDHSKVISALGFLPKLAQFNLQTFDSYPPDTASSLIRDFIPWLITHRSTFTRLQLQSSASDEIFPESILGPLTTTGPSLQLSAFSIHCHSLRCNRALVPSLARFKDSLTTLAVIVSPHDRGWYDEEFHDLLLSLHRLSHGILLRRLETSVDRLSPEIFDFMSTHLPNLDTLALGYAKPAGTKDLDNSNKDAFQESFSTRTYPSWNLQRLYLYHLSSSSPNVSRMRFVAGRIPSVREFGPFDWSDIRLDVGPWY